VVAYVVLWLRRRPFPRHGSSLLSLFRLRENSFPLGFPCFDIFSLLTLHPGRGDLVVKSFPSSELVGIRVILFSKFDPLRNIFFLLFGVRRWPPFPGDLSLKPGISFFPPRPVLDVLSLGRLGWYPCSAGHSFQCDCHAFVKALPSSFPNSPPFLLSKKAPNEPRLLRLRLCGASGPGIFFFGHHTSLTPSRLIQPLLSPLGRLKS